LGCLVGNRHPIGGANPRPAPRMAAYTVPTSAEYGFMSHWAGAGRGATVIGLAAGSRRVRKLLPSPAPLRQAKMGRSDLKTGKLDPGVASRPGSLLRADSCSYYLSDSPALTRSLTEAGARR
jgi:hypothetical protein